MEEQAEDRSQCSLCTRAARRRRTLCWACYQKLRHAGIKLPDKLRTGRPRDIVPLLVAIIHALTTEERAKVRAALEAA